MILIIGCGFLGQYILKELQPYATEPIIATYKSNINNSLTAMSNLRWIKFDSTKKEDIKRLHSICGKQSLTVFYLASCHNIDYIFEHSTTAYYLNVTALANFLNMFSTINSFFYSSTDCVYGEGLKSVSPFKETDKTNPLNIYGIQKKEAEQIVLQAGHHVLRLPYMLGPSLSTKKNFYDTIIDSLNASHPVQMIDGIKRSVLSYKQVAKILVRLSSEDSVPSILNIASDNGYTKYEMGCKIAERFGFNNKLIIKMSEETSARLFKDMRAKSAIMSNQLLKNILKIDQLDWEC